MGRKTTLPGMVKSEDDTPLCSVRDTKQARDLLPAQAQLQHLLSTTPAVIYSCRKSANWGPVFVSENVTSLFGYEPREFLEHKDFWDERVHPEDCQRVLAALPQIVSNGHLGVEYRFRHKDGSYRWIHDEVRILSDAEGEPKETVGCWTDITERKQTEEELSRNLQELEKARASAEKHAAELESLISSIPDGVSLIDARGTAVWMNDAGKAILGAEPDETFENWTTRCMRFALDGQPVLPHETPVSRAIRGETTQDIRYKVISPSGKETIISISVSPVRNSKGEVIGVTDVFRDITELVETERQTNRRFERERHIADTLQRALIPEVALEMEGYRIAADYCPALEEAEVGGDFYDVFQVKDGRVAIVMGDVSGKGLQAAIHTAMAKYILRAYAHENPEPGFVLRRLNEAIYHYTPDDVFVTLFYGLLDPGKGMLIYANAGHEGPLCYSNRLGWAVSLDITGRAVGIIEDTSFGQRKHRMETGDILLVYTDGITDARSDGKFLGVDGLRNAFLEAVRDGNGRLTDAILEAATTAASGRLRDDAAVLVVQAG